MVVACIPCLLSLTEKSLSLLVKLVQVGYLSFLTMLSPSQKGNNCECRVRNWGNIGYGGSVLPLGNACIIDGPQAEEVM